MSNDKMPRVISNSGGRTSGYMTHIEVEKGLGPEDYIIFCNTGKEREETLEFIHRQQTVLGWPIIWLEFCRFNKWKQVSFETASRKGEPFEAILLDRRRWKWQPFIEETILLADEVLAPVGSDLWRLYYRPEEFRATVEDEYGQQHPATLWTSQRPAALPAAPEALPDLFDLAADDVPSDALWLRPRPEFREEVVSKPNPNPFGLYLPNMMSRFCTQELKIRVMRDFMRSMGHGHWDNIVGIRADEPRRHSDAKQSYDSRFDVLHPLYHAGIRKPDVLAHWKTQPFDLELQDHEGNCDQCYLKGKGKRLDLMRKRPEESQWWSDCETAVGFNWTKRESYAQLQKQASATPTLDFISTYNEPTIGCFCGD